MLCFFYIYNTACFLDSGRNLFKRVDNYAGKTYNIVYTNGKITSVIDGTLTVTQEYDEYNEADGISYAYEGYTDSYSQEKDALGRVTAETTPLGTVSYSYDTMGRLTSRTAYGKTESYTYKDGSTSGYTTPLVKKLTYSDGTAYNYTYDSEGKITQITNKSGVLVAQFEYDSLKRLSVERIYGSRTVTYTYNQYGDITRKKIYNFTMSSVLNDTCYLYGYTYSYDAQGRLTQSKYDSIAGSSTKSSECTYDANGNPTTYLGNTLTWTRRRLLAGYGSNTYSYNADGIRFQKNDTEYILDGNRILAEVENGTVTKRYFYDGNGIACMEYDGSKYYFRKNLQGDVVSVLNESGTSVASYTYDAWGAVITSSGTMASMNPFRYRGYYYDTETRLYYLQSRYYDPTTGRFLNPDTYSYSEPETLHGLNLYVYCNNNPVMGYDPNGNVVISSLLIGLCIYAGTGAIVGAASYAISECVSGIFTQEWTWSWGMFLGSFIGGAIGGALSFFIPLNMVSSAITGALSTSIGMVLENAFGEAENSVLDIVVATLRSAAVSAVCAGATEYIAKCFHIPKIVGRGSITQVAKQINTKLLRGTISRISAKTFAKILAYGAFYSAVSTVASGIIDIYEENKYIKDHALQGCSGF